MASRVQTLTTRQSQVHEFILAYSVANGTSPTYGEIGQRLNLCESVVTRHVRALVRKGWATVRPGKHRAMVALKPAQVAPYLP